MVGGREGEREGRREGGREGEREEGREEGREGMREGGVLFGLNKITSPIEIRRKGVGGLRDGE